MPSLTVKFASTDKKYCHLKILQLVGLIMHSCHVNPLLHNILLPLDISYKMHAANPVHPILDKCPCTAFHGVNVAASIQTYTIYTGKCPCGPKSRVLFKRPWTLTRDTMVCTKCMQLIQCVQLRNAFSYWYIWTYFKVCVAISLVFYVHSSDSSEIKWKHTKQ